MKKILVVGDIYSETQFFVEKIPLKNSFAFANKIVGIIGSKTLNAARILGRYKNDVTYLGVIGNDIEGQVVFEAMNKFNIKGELLKIETALTGKIVVLTDDEGKSAITLFSGANKYFSPSIIQRNENLIQNCDAIYTATSLPLETLYFLVGLSQKYSKQIFLDIPNQHKNINLELISSVNFFMPNRQETELLLGLSVSKVSNAKKAALQLRRHISGTILITLDKDGCVLLEKNTDIPQHFRCAETDSIDDTAAGDVFRAVFTHTYLQTDKLVESVNKALTIASYSTLIKGVDRTLQEVSI